MLSIFGDVIDEVVPLARSAEITYRRAGLGILTAIATVDEPPDLIRARFDESGRVDFSVAARVENEQGKLVADATVRWHVRRSHTSTRGLRG